MHAAVDEGDGAQACTTSLLVQAQRAAEALRASAAHTRDRPTRLARLRQAAVIDELIRYGEDRDRALAARVTECARLRAELEASTWR